jgi:hypothetical protein
VNVAGARDVGVRQPQTVLLNLDSVIIHFPGWIIGVMGRVRRHLVTPHSLPV